MLQELAKPKIDEILEMNVIELVEEPTHWCSDLTIAPKPNGKLVSV